MEHSAVFGNRNLYGRICGNAAVAYEIGSLDRKENSNGMAEALEPASISPC
jgi:hypothetical protein